ncbi:isochorismatase family cysteine hydrolase [Vineibacter terrae]|uniref:cysteine hydrolase family protein n=1 Tax=Vineibacter terrae TaxID=2586908 RepID=UPI002E2F4493|nr:isochorismatase family cysteine hydrolase [Vineibacter terrae]HEX2887059.1 isochorismatase family cysteine hydrolase [Vineibacter terrae]
MPEGGGQATVADRGRDPALLVVDMQNDFVRVGAPLEVPAARDTVAAHRRLIAAFRAAGRPVLYTRFIAQPFETLLWHWSPQCRPPVKCCWPGHGRSYGDCEGPRDCAAVIDELQPDASDVVVDKHGYGAFHGTELAARLAALGVVSLFVTGTVTQICVEESAREAFHHGFPTTLVADAVSSFDAALHAATLRNFAMKFGWVEDSDAVVRRLREKTTP